MEKIDLIRRQNTRSMKLESPNTDAMFPLRTDERTVFYFRSEERREAFKKKHNIK